MHITILFESDPLLLFAQSVAMILFCHPTQLWVDHCASSTQFTILNEFLKSSLYLAGQVQCNRLCYAKYEDVL